MQYCSTRNASWKESSAHAIRCGLAPDGGLFLPEAIPALSYEDILAMRFDSYPVRAAKLLSLFLTDYEPEKLLSFTERAYASGRFPAPSPAPVVPIGDNTHVLELFRGPTAAFKDMALQMLPLLLTEAMRLEGIREKVLILTATSGDTGSAAMTGFSDVENTAICVYYPKGGTSLLQRLQMTTQSGKNVLTAAVRGNFDDAQRGVKAIFADNAWKEKLKSHGFVLSSANSINFGRIAPQIVYYFSGYLDMLNAGSIAPGESISVAVPTGNFGNILSAYYAKQMGLPVKTLICASNRNKVLFDFIRTGTYDKRRSFYRTSSPSMDILVSSNLERMLYLLADGDAALTAEYMQLLSAEGCYSIREDMRARLQKDFTAYWTDEEGTAASIRLTKERCHYLPDTHTAVALDAVRQFRAETGSGDKVLVAATASPFKFPGTVLQALGEAVPENEFEMLGRLEAVTGEKAPAALRMLRDKPERFTGETEKDSMADVLTALL